MVLRRELFSGIAILISYFRLCYRSTQPRIVEFLGVWDGVGRFDYRQQLKRLAELATAPNIPKLMQNRLFLDGTAAHQ